jgi:serine/threonine protein kinase
MDCKVVQNYVVTPIKLGEGCFGTVYRGYVKNNKTELLAVKTIALDTIKNEELIKREIEILLKLKSPNIVKYISL